MVRILILWSIDLLLNSNRNSNSESLFDHMSFELN